MAARPGRPITAATLEVAAAIAACMLLQLAVVAASPLTRCDPALGWHALQPGQPEQHVLEAVVAEAFQRQPDAGSQAPCNASDVEASVDGCQQDLVGTLYSLAINLTCPQNSSWSMRLAAEVHAGPQQLSTTTQVLSLVQLSVDSMQPQPAPANLSGADITGPRGRCSMTISDVVMAYTDLSANSEGGFSSIYGEDKDCCFDPAFMTEAQGLFTSLADTMVWLAKGFNKSAEACVLTEEWALELAFAHCLLTPADQAALRQAVITHNSSLCPAFYREAYLKAPLSCRTAVASIADISYPFFRLVFDACQVPY